MSLKHKQKTDSYVSFSRIKHIYGLTLSGKLLFKVKHVWGVFFRFVFILSFGFLLYTLIPQKSIADIPFSQLTLDYIVDSMLRIAPPIFCAFWLLNFPKGSYNEESEDSPYIIWANLSGFLLLFAALAYIIINR